VVCVAWRGAAWHGLRGEAGGAGDAAPHAVPGALPAGLVPAARVHAAPLAELLPSACLPNLPTLPACLAVCRANDVDVVTLGQYMRPTKKHMAVAEYVTPDAFAAYQKVRPAGAAGSAGPAHGTTRLRVLRDLLSRELARLGIWGRAVGCLSPQPQSPPTATPLTLPLPPPPCRLLRSLGSCTLPAGPWCAAATARASSI
jgi:hypothetical protein